VHRYFSNLFLQITLTIKYLRRYIKGVNYVILGRCFSLSNFVISKGTSYTKPIKYEGTFERRYLSLGGTTAKLAII
jgi:hypothetical protein